MRILKTKINATVMKNYMMIKKIKFKKVNTEIIIIYQLPRNRLTRSLKILLKLIITFKILQMINMYIKIKVKLSKREAVLLKCNSKSIRKKVKFL
jgi:hypothetical protein